MAVSDPVLLTWVTNPANPMLANRDLAISFHVAGDSGPMTWHAKALTTSYLSGPHTGSHGADNGDEAFPFSTTSWFFLDEVDMAIPGAKTVVAFGDSITDGTASTLNGDDRWPDVFSRRMHAALGNRYSVVNEGIGGNMVIGPLDYAAKPFSGGPAALDRLERDVISLPNVSTVIWLEGINDFGNAGAETKSVSDGVRDAVGKLRAGIPGVKIFMATLTSSLHSTARATTAPPRGRRKARRLQRIHQIGGDFRRRRRLRRGNDRPGDGRAQSRVPAELDDRRARGEVASEPGPECAAMGRAIDLSMVFGGAPKK